MSTMWYHRCKMKKEVKKAGVLLYALLMATIFSLLLQFYRQVAGRRILKTSQDRLRAMLWYNWLLKKKSDEKTSEFI